MRETPSGPRAKRRDTTLIALVVMLILGLATALRFYHLGGQSLWADEGNSAVMATRSFAEITTNAANDIHPPLYYWLLRLWTQFAGVSEVGLRSLSALLGVLLVFATIGLGLRMGGVGIGLLAGLLAAVSPFQVYYSQEARMYMLLALEAAGAVYGFWALLRHEEQRLREWAARPQEPGRQADDRAAPSAAALPWPMPLIFLSWVAGLYTHYAFPVLIATLSLVYLLWLVVTRRRGRVLARLGRLAMLLGLTLVAFLPWLGIAIRQITGWPTGGQSTDLVKALSTIFTVLVLGPTGRLAAAQWPIWLSMAVLALGLIPWRQTLKRSSGMGWLLPILWLAAPLAMMLALGLVRDAYLKFLLIASPAVALLLARGVLGPGSSVGNLGERLPDALHTRRAGLRLSGLGTALWSLAALILLLTSSASTLSRYFSDPKAARDDYRGITQFIVATSHPLDAILLVAPGQSEVLRYYYTGDLPVYVLPQERPLSHAATEAALAKLLNHEKVYAVYWAVQEADPEDFIQNWINHRGYKTLDQWRGNVRLVVYVMPERRPPAEEIQALDLGLGPDILLKGYRSGNLTLTAGEVTQLQLVWLAINKPERRYKVFLQLLDAHDQVIAQRDSEPVGDSRPTDLWEPGEEILDNHGVLIPPGTPPGDYRRIVGLYDRDTGKRVQTADGKDFISLTPVRVMRTTAPIALAALNMRHDQQFDFGAISLLGHDRYKRDFGHAPETPLHPGDRLHATLYWRANERPRAHWWFDLTLNDATGGQVAKLGWPLVSESYPTTQWAQGEVVRGEHDLQLPANLPPGIYQLSLVMLPDANTPVGSAYLGAVEVSKPPAEVK